jgi:hypothetical protein
LLSAEAWLFTQVALCTWKMNGVFVTRMAGNGADLLVDHHWDCIADAVAALGVGAQVPTRAYPLGIVPVRVWMSAPAARRAGLRIRDETSCGMQRGGGERSGQYGSH